ncbi:MAG: BatA domain-containing protein [Planctomycetes bacterium]|nr:BatA domain-containing protein [Planctomycetota bacterium]
MPAFGSAWFLYFGLLLGVPVIIHLIYGLRRKRVPTGAMWMIRRIVEHNARRLRLRDILLLLLRMAALALIVLAFARPVAWIGLENAGRTLVIIDDGFPMKEIMPGGDTLFETAVRKIGPHLEGGEYALFTLSGRMEGEFSDRNALKATLERMRPCSLKGDLKTALSRAAAAQASSRAVVAVGAWQDLGPGEPPVVHARLGHIEVPPRPPGCSIRIAGIRPVPGGKGVEVECLVEDDRSLQHTVRLYRLGENGAREEITGRPVSEDGRTVLTAHNLPLQGTVLLAAAVDGRDGLASDDIAYMALELLPPLRVGVIVNRIASPAFMSDGFYVKTALEVGTGFIVNEYASGDLLAAAKQCDVLLFTDASLVPQEPGAELLAKGWILFSGGGARPLAIAEASGLLPATAADPAAVPVAVDQDFPPIAGLPADMFMALDWGEAPGIAAGGAWRPALSLQGRSRILYRFEETGRGRRVFIAGPPGRTHGADLPLHKVFAPMVRELAAWTGLRLSPEGVDCKIGAVGEIWDLPADTLQVLGPDGTALQLDSGRGKHGVRLLEPGIYTALIGGKGGDAGQAVRAANLVAITAGRSLDTMALGGLFQPDEGARAKEEEPDPGAGPWRILALIALAVLVVEGLLSAAPIVTLKKRGPA